MIHTNMPRKYTVSFLPRRLTRSAIYMYTYGSQIFDSHKWPTVLHVIRRVKGKPRNFEHRKSLYFVLSFILYTRPDNTIPLNAIHVSVLFQF